MKQHLVVFEAIPWVDAGKGMRYKKFEKDNKILRLIELTKDYEELDWCHHGHIGVIIEGIFRVTFEDHMEEFKQGDVVWVSAGEGDKHKASVPDEKPMLMLSFEM